jgi:hypothetical protein
LQISLFRKEHSQGIAVIIADKGSARLSYLTPEMERIICPDSSVSQGIYLGILYNEIDLAGSIVAEFSSDIHLDRRATRAEHRTQKQREEYDVNMFDFFHRFYGIYTNVVNFLLNLGIKTANYSFYCDLGV